MKYLPNHICNDKCNVGDMIQYHKGTSPEGWERSLAMNGKSFVHLTDKKGKRTMRLVSKTGSIEPLPDGGTYQEIRNQDGHIQSTVQKDAEGIIVFKREVGEDGVLQEVQLPRQKRITATLNKRKHNEKDEKDDKWVFVSDSDKGAPKKQKINVVNKNVTNTFQMEQDFRNKYQPKESGEFNIVMMAGGKNNCKLFMPSDTEGRRLFLEDYLRCVKAGCRMTMKEQVAASRNDKRMKLLVDLNFKFDEEVPDIPRLIDVIQKSVRDTYGLWR
ncbi:hypothetical protein HK104_011443 [Borealophlyctis nickersoniae]|nr:hypothetical protein HK104_011443 [Borealophlyctis nickersoniae]